MLRNIDLDEISDGKLYTAGDLAKVGCQDCEGCCDCCCQMGDTIILDPLDVWQLMQGRDKSFEQLLDESLDLHVQDGVILPNLKMAGEKEQCVYLNEKGRCSIHPFRPGICRLFPLGRFYENGSFRYFLQTKECSRENRTKQKIRKWIDMPEFGRYEAFVADWHFFCAQAAGSPDAAVRYGGSAEDQSLHFAGILFSGLGCRTEFLRSVLRTIEKSTKRACINRTYVLS